MSVVYLGLSSPLHPSHEWYKARYVAKGLSQIPGIDFDETFAPVALYDSLLLLLTLSAHYDWKPVQLDVKSAFLYGELNETIYLELPEGYRQGDKVWKLQKCIYGLKQSPREWYARLAASLAEKGFTPTHFDPCVFVKLKHNFYPSVYVNVIMIFGGAIPFQRYLITALKQDFDCRDMGIEKYILGIEIKYTDTDIEIFQLGYLNKILGKFGMMDAKPIGTPLDNNNTIIKPQPDETMTDITKY